jgi:hypothetical protein
MLVGITSFGSVWRRRFGRDPGDPERFRRAAYFNTTGILVNGHVIHHRKIAGHVRFNGVGGFHPYYIERTIGSVFECDAPCVWNGQNKVFFERRIACSVLPEYFLVVLRTREVGHVNVGAPGWKSEDSLLISFSEWRDEQETMFLMRPDAWVQTSLGRVIVLRVPARPWAGRPCLRE